MSNKHIYYVYAYLRSKDSKTAKAGTPYYIGKGKGGRAYARHRTMPTDLSYIIFIERNLSDIGALALERQLIRWYGRIDLGSGILHNMTDGGEGSSGYIQSNKTKAKRSASMTEWRKTHSTKGEKNGMYGRKHSDEVKKASSIRRAATNSSRRWYNNGITSLFLVSPPNETWVLGRINQKPTTAGNRWYNNGVIRKSCSEHPGEGWTLGMMKDRKANS